MHIQAAEAEIHILLQRPAALLEESTETLVTVLVEMHTKMTQVKAQTVLE
jgi:hypothetical protein